MAIDFFGCRLSGRIRQFVKGSGQGPGKVVELWTESQDSELTKFRALAFVSELSISLKMGENATISMVLTPPFEEGLTLMQSELVRFGNGRLEVEIGYTTGTSTGSGAIEQTTLPFSGFLQPPNVSVGSDITITLNAFGVGYQMNVVGGVEDETFNETFSPAKAVLTTLQKYISTDGSSSGLKVTEEKLFEYVPKEKKDPIKGDLFFRTPGSKDFARGVNQLLDILNKSDGFLTGNKPPSSFPDAKVYSGLVQKGPRNDWWFVKETCEEFGYDLFIEGNELHIVEKSFWMINGFGDRKGRKHFLLRGPVDPTRNIFPIIGFQSSSENVFQQPGIGSLTMFDFNSKADEAEQAKASASETPIAKGKEGSDPDKFFSIKGSLSRVMPGSPSDEQSVKRMQAHWTDKNLKDGVNVVVTTLGIPGLSPGDVVQLGGFEPYDGFVGATENAIYNGVYGVFEVNHKIGVGGWETSFIGISNTLPKAFEEAAKQALLDAEPKASRTEPAIGSAGQRRVPPLPNAPLAKTLDSIAKNNPIDTDFPSDTSIISPKREF
jgi:hypothetical protein